MRKLRKSNRRAGRVTINVSSSESGGILVTVARACNNPAVLKLVDELLDKIRRDPRVVIKDVEPEVPLHALVRKRGGPAGTPEGQKIEIVKGWFRVQGRMRAIDYASSRGISPATLRRWIRELIDDGKL